LVQSFSFLGSFLCWHFQRRVRLEGLAAFVGGQQISGEFARHRQRGAVAMSALQLAGMQRRQLRIPSRGQLGGRGRGAAFCRSPFAYAVGFYFDT